MREDGNPLPTIEARWWLPAHPDDRLPGTATFDGTTVRLRVAGSFRAFNFKAATDTAVLVGESNLGGRTCAIHGAFLESERPGKETVIQGEYLFDGAAVSALEQPLWAKAYLRLDELDRWFQIFPFHMDGNGDRDGEVLLRRNTRKQMSAVLSECTITLSDVLTNMSYGFRRAAFEATAELELVYPAPTPFLKIVADCHRLQILISLLANRVMPQRRLVLETIDEESMPVTVYYSSPYGWLAPDPSAKPDPEDEIAGYPAIKDDFPTILNGWWASFDRTRVSTQLLMMTLGSATLEANLLTVAQALESYHRGSKPGTYLSPEAYEPVRVALLAAIPAGIPQGLESSLEARVRFGNEHSLRTRIRSLLESLDEAFRSILIPNVASFVDRFVTTRNSFTHGLSPGEEDRVWHGAELAYGTARARWLLLACLLQGLGVRPERILSIARRNAHFRFLTGARRAEEP